MSIQEVLEVTDDVSQGREEFMRSAPTRAPLSSRSDHRPDPRPDVMLHQHGEAEKDEAAGEIWIPPPACVLRCERADD